jgi:hypothetical protein
MFCARQLSYDGTMWHETNSGDRSMVGRNISLGQRVEVGTRLILREGRRQFATGRSSALASVCGRRPDPGYRVASMRSSHNRHSVATQATGANAASRSARAGFDVRTTVC